MIAISLTLQFNMFSEMPFRMEFPGGLFATLVVMAVAVAVLGSVVPAVGLLRKSISNVIRRQ